MLLKILLYDTEEDAKEETFKKYFDDVFGCIDLSYVSSVVTFILGRGTPDTLDFAIYFAPHNIDEAARLASFANMQYLKISK
jgi:hypothetical protein